MAHDDLWMIAAVGSDRTIGINGALPWHIPEDLRRFRDLTQHRPIIMGRRTFESIGRPLPHRHSIVLSRSSFSHPAATVVSSASDAVAAARSSRLYGANGAAVIGGESVYREFLDCVSRIELTIVQPSETGDAFFPLLKPGEWAIGWSGKAESSECSFWRLERSSVARQGHKNPTTRADAAADLALLFRDPAH